MGKRTPSTRSGSVLLIAIVLVVVVAGLSGAYLAVASIHAEATIRDEARQRLLSVAEAGIDHARVTLAAGLADGWSDELAAPQPYVAESLADGRYEVRLEDNDDEVPSDPRSDVDLVVVLVCSAHVPFGEGTQEVLLRVIVKGENGTTLSSLALLTGDDLVISGNPMIAGSNGSVHSNGDIKYSGSAYIEQDLSTSGEFTQLPSHIAIGGGVPHGGGGSYVGGTVTANAPPLPIPPVVPAQYRSSADYVMTASGLVLDRSGVVVADAGPGGGAFRGWRMTGNGTWDLSGDVGFDGAYYFQGDVKVSGNPGEAALQPWRVTILAEGDVSISGNPYMTWYADNILVVGGRDVEISGNPTQSDVNENFEGILLAHENVKLNGNPTIFGCVIAEDAPPSRPDNSPVKGSQVSGNPSITNDGSLAWRAPGAPRVPIKGYSQDLYTNVAR